MQGKPTWLSEVQIWRGPAWSPYLKSISWVNCWKLKPHSIVVFEWEDTWPYSRLGGWGWGLGIWRDFLERAEAVALLRPLSTTIQTYSMASDHSLVTTLLAQSLIFKIWQSGKASCWNGLWRQYKSLRQHIWRLSVNRMPFSGQKPPPKPIKCVRKVKRSKHSTSLTTCWVPLVFLVNWTGEIT